MTLLELIQEFCRRSALSVPDVVMTASEDLHLQLAGILNMWLDDVVNRYDWAELETEATWTSVASEDQGALETLAPGFVKILSDTIYDRTARVALLGPQTAKDWQLQEATTSLNTYPRYRVLRKHLYVQPALAAGHTIAFEYKSRFAVLSNTLTAKQYFTADDDTCKFPDALLLAGLRWRWLAMKGLPFEVAFQDHENLLATAKGDNKVATAITMHDGGSTGPMRPGIVVPSSNWNLP